ncbi:MAG: DUF433 domain-containing protein [Symploca sp. SIO1C2]|nr:DUF433 domain-containing protein [Symploca sp. SIO1C2]
MTWNDYLKLLINRKVKIVGKIVGWVEERNPTKSEGLLLNDPTFTKISYRQGASGQPVAVISGTGIRVQTIAIAAYRWGLSSDQLAQEYGLTETQLSDALGFYIKSG